MNTNHHQLDLTERPRRLRKNAAIRDLCRETRVAVTDFIQPVFVIDGMNREVAVKSMPGIHRRSRDLLVRHCRELATLGIRGVALFPNVAPERKTADGREALNHESLVLRAIRELKSAIPELLIFADIALDPYTTHGHDGLYDIRKQTVANDATIEILCEMAILHAEAGVDFVAPSDMMDGRIGAIRRALDGHGYTDTGILSYSAKFASAYYGPFRDAVGSAKAAGSTYLDKGTYQLDPANRREARRETRLDEAEGADILMVKPAGPYLDIIRDLRENTVLPVAAYQVSGEYSQIHAAAERGWLDLTKTRDESLLAIRRAGADLIFTYFAEAIAREAAGPSDDGVDA